MRLNVYAFGSALMDVQMHVDESVFDMLGVDKGNMYLTERERQEEVLQKLLGTDSLDIDHMQDNVNTAAGGSAANTVCGVAQLGGQAGFCGKVADDTFGALYVKHMQDSRVVFSPGYAQGMTGSCVVLISDDAQRTMLTYLGVASDIDYEDVDEEQLVQSDYIYLEGYLFDSERATRTMLRAIETAKKNGVRVALTASDAFCVERHRDIFLQLIRSDADLLFANAQEACALSGAEGTEQALEVLAGMCKNVAVTDGDRGSILNFGGEVIKIAPHLVTPFDTTGAGDSYAGGLLFGLTNNYTLEQSGKIASFFSSRVVAQLGPRYSGDVKNELVCLRL